MDIALISLILFGLTFAAVSLVLLFLKFRRRSSETEIGESIPVSVFKPLKGLDSELEANLRTFFEQEYPEFELLFGVNDTDDPAIPVVRKLQRQYPHISAKLIVDTSLTGFNPKVNNLCNLYRRASYSCFIISDSNIRVDRDYIQDMVAHLNKPGVGLVTSYIRGVCADSAGAVLENLHMNSFIALSVRAIELFFRIPITIGKSMCFRRETLDQLGGFEAFSDYLIEDALLGQHIQELGLTVEHTTACIENVNTNWSISDFLNRHIRWGTMRRFLSLPNYTAEIFSNPISLALIYWLYRMDVLGAVVFGITCGVKILIDSLALAVLRSDNKWYHPFIVPFKDILMGIVWFLPFFRRLVVWRGNKFIISRNTLVRPAPESSYVFSGNNLSKVPSKIWYFTAYGTRRLMTLFNL